MFGRGSALRWGGAKRAWSQRVPGQPCFCIMGLIPEPEVERCQFAQGGASLMESRHVPSCSFFLPFLFGTVRMVVCIKGGPKRLHKCNP